MPGETVALLLSTDAFEEFYGKGLGLDRDAYVDRYRNDWSWEYASALRNQGLRPILYLPTYGPGELRPTKDDVWVRFVPLSALDVPWRHIGALRRTPVGRYLQQWVNARSLLPALQAALAEDAVTTLLVQEYWTARWDVLSGLATPTIAIDQGQPDRRELKFFKRRAFGRAQTVVVQTSAEAQKVRRYGGEPVRVPNGVNTDRYRPSPATVRRPHELLMVARLLDVQKRVSDAIRAVAALGAPWTLRVLGGGPDEGQLRRLSRELGVEHRVTFEGFVMDRDAIVAAMQRCGVFLLPSAYEGLPMALLEAMACECAVVGSTIPAIAEVIEHGRTGLTVDPGDVTKLADSVVEASEHRQGLGTEARRVVLATYSLEACGVALAELVREGARALAAPDGRLLPLRDLAR